MEFIEKYRWMMVFFAAGGLGMASYQLKTMTFSLKRPGETRAMTVRRADAPVRWFASTLGWLLIGGIGLALAVAPSFRG